MATTIVDWLNDGTIPQSKTSGNWTPSQFNTGKFRFTLTFTAASTGSPWRPASTTYWGVLTTNDANGAAVWLEYDSGTATHRLLFVASDGSTILGALTFTWGASSAVTVTIDQSSAAAGASTMTLAGAATGNGTTAGWTRASVFSGSGLYFGVWGSGGFQFPAGGVTTSDIDDANDVVTRTASTSSAVDASLSAARQVIRSAAATVAVAATLAATAVTVRTASTSSTVDASLSATVVGGGTTRTASTSSAVDASLAATRQVTRSAAAATAATAALAATRAVTRSASASSAVDASLAATTTGTSFALGVTSSAIATYGHSAATLSAPGGYLPSGGGGADEDGRTPTAVATQATGSAIYALAARPTSVNTALTDNYANTYVGVEAMTLEPPWTAWEIVSEVALGADGGSNHIVTTDSVVSDEATLIWTEIKQCAHLNDSSAVFRGIGTSLVSVGVDLDAPGWVIVDAVGDSGTFGAEDFAWTMAAVGEGSTVGTHWQRLDARLLNHNDGWIPVVRFARYYAASTAGITLTVDDATLNPNQGVYLFAAAFQEVNVTTRTASTSSTVSAALAATRQVARSASISSAAAASLAATRAVVRTAATTSGVEASLAAGRIVTATASTAAAVEASLAATRQVVRPASTTSAVDASLAATRAVHRQASVTAATAAALSVGRTVERTAATAAEVAASLSADHTPAGTATRSAATNSAVEASLAATRQVVRSADGSSAVDAALAATRVVVRSAAASNAVAAALAITVGGTVVVSLPRNYTVRQADYRARYRRAP